MKIEMIHTLKIIYFIIEQSYQFFTLLSKVLESIILIHDNGKKFVEFISKESFFKIEGSKGPDTYLVPTKLVEDITNSNDVAGGEVEETSDNDTI